MANPILYTGEDAVVWIRNNTGTTVGGWIEDATLAISDFSLTISRGTAEQELVGSKGNFQLAGVRNVEGSLTACRLTTTGLGSLISGMINGTGIQISGMVGPNGLRFFFKSAMITGFDFSIGTADDITEGSLDYTLLNSYQVSGVQTTSTFVGISDWHHY
jgi:hypothetical protein